MMRQHKEQRGRGHLWQIHHCAGETVPQRGGECFRDGVGENCEVDSYGLDLT